MKWLSEAQIKKAAETSDLEAMKCSVEHWKQLWMAKAGELRKGQKKGKVNTGYEHCALCERHYDTSCLPTCPIRQIGISIGYCDNTPYERADKAFLNWLDGIGPWHTWKSAAKAEYEFLLGIYKKMLKDNPPIRALKSE